MKTESQISDCIVKLVDSNEDPTTWAEIRDEVTRFGFRETKTRNWLFVRGALQLAINNGAVKRTDHFNNECYKSVANAVRKDLDQLTKEYNAWGAENGFLGEDLKSADEMELTYPDMTLEQKLWISEFIDDWHTECEREY
jgi:hypothetical protein